MKWRTGSVSITGSLLIITFWNFSPVLSCGVQPIVPMMPMPVRTVEFEVTHFTLPVRMVYTTENSVHAQVPRISTSEEQAKNVLNRLLNGVIRAVFEREGVIFSLPPYVVEQILLEITVNTTYIPLKCNNVLVEKPLTEPLTYDKGKEENCFIRKNKVVALCKDPAKKCAITPVKSGKPDDPEPAKNVPRKHVSFRGTLQTTNMYMVNWSYWDWKRIFDVVEWTLKNSEFARNFYKAIVTFKLK
ncbi:hypothetical protein KIN20_000020 [Parelaphostrongylus tenuis]|uniref:Uncharacterized protein n=1 Tax=Parelaphostrongylus tenuis TaxID=148309 RepID=A0AAD5QBI4_PARTN|nr:hypothetical protein KIN20_000020 [Parelaphostrongylus tenuis]